MTRNDENNEVYHNLTESVDNKAPVLKDVNTVLYFFFLNGNVY
jgi:hypothetical protein